MTEAAGLMLVQEIMPLIVGAVHRGAVRGVVVEDAEELAQDGLAIAAQHLDAAERNGKQFTPGTIAWFALKTIKAGRRSTGSSTTDVLAPGTQLQGRSTIQSLDEPLDDDDETNLHDVLADKREDVASEAARRLDWQLVGLDDRQKAVLHGTAVGMQVREMAEQYNVSPPRIIQIRRDAGDRIRDAWGTTGLEDNRPAWKRMVR